MRIGNIKIDHKRCIKTNTEALELEKTRAGSKLQSISPIRVDHLRWLRIQQYDILKAIEKVREGEEVRFDLGDDLYVSVSVYGPDVMTIVHIRYYFHSDDGSKLMPTRNGISIQGEKWKDLAQILLNIELPNACKRVKFLVGQIIQEDARDKLWEIAYKKKVAPGSSTTQMFVERFIREVMEDVEKDMQRNFKLYDLCVPYIQLPLVKGEDVFQFYYNDEMKKDIMHLTEVNEDYHTPSQLLIETVQEDAEDSLLK